MSTYGIASIKTKNTISQKMLAIKQNDSEESFSISVNRLFKRKKYTYRIVKLYEKEVEIEIDMQIAFGSFEKTSDAYNITNNH